MSDLFFANSPHPYTGFGDEITSSVKFHTIMTSDHAPDWESGLRMAQLTPATGNDLISQRRGRDPWSISLRLWLSGPRDLERLDAMKGRRATLRYCWNVTKSLGTQPQTIQGAQYQSLPDTMLLDLSDVAIDGDGTLEVTATFQRAYVDPSPVVPPVWPPAPNPVPAYSDIVLATPGLRTYHKMSGGATEASVGPDTALMTHTGSPVTAVSLVTRGDGAKRYSGTAMESTFSTSALSGATAGSLECWFREDSLVAWAHILENDDYPTSRFQIIRNASTATISAGFRDPVGAGDYAATGPYAQLSLNHVVTTFDGTTIRLYINGTQVASTPMAGFFPSGSKTFRANKAGSQALAGVIDEVAIYNVALSPATILQHYQAGTAS